MCSLMRVARSQRREPSYATRRLDQYTPKRVEAPHSHSTEEAQDWQRSLRPDGVGPERGRKNHQGHLSSWRAPHHPENTLPAFQAAIDAGADYFELDVRTTSDGKFVLMHDSTLDLQASEFAQVLR
jgi:hypothetical protein